MTFSQAAFFRVAIVSFASLAFFFVAPDLLAVDEHSVTEEATREESFAGETASAVFFRESGPGRPLFFPAARVDADFTFTFFGPRRLGPSPADDWTPASSDFFEAVFETRERDADFSFGFDLAVLGTGRLSPN